jgi:hypothetical protein
VATPKPTVQDNQDTLGRGGSGKLNRRNYISTFKSKAALAAIRGEQALIEPPQKYDVSLHQIKQCRDHLIKDASDVFEK